MKRFIRTIFVLLAVAVVALAPMLVAHAQPAAAAPHVVAGLTPAAVSIAAPAQQAPEEGLTEAQLFLVGLVASAFLWVLKLVISQGYQPTKEVVAIALYIVAFGMALLFKAFAFPAFPPFTDAPGFAKGLLTYIGALLELAAPIVGLAYLIYNVFLQRVLEAGLKGARKALISGTQPR